MKLGIIITQTDAETVFNALRLALLSLQQGDQVRIFLSGKGVDIDKIEDPIAMTEQGIRDLKQDLSATAPPSA